MVGGIPQSTKRVKLAPLNEVGPSKDPLFIESEPEEESASETSETLPAGLAELEGAIQAQTTALQDQLATQEWLAGRLERVAVALDGHRTAMEDVSSIKYTTNCLCHMHWLSPISLIIIGILPIVHSL